MNTASQKSERPEQPTQGFQREQGRTVKEIFSQSKTGVNGLLQAALAYAERGWFVLPCRPYGKEPLTRHGVNDATRDAETILRWHEHWPDANIAIATGAQSGFVVLDSDPRNGGDISLELLESKHGALPETIEALSGGGGRHWLFQHPGGVIKNSKSELAPGLDVLGDGAYIIASPSIHPAGGVYEWEVTHGPGDVPLAPLPVWLLRLGSSLRRQICRPALGLIPNGTVHYTFVSWAGAMHSRGMSPGAILAALLHENATRCDPVRPEANIRKIVEDITTRYEPGNVPSAWQILAHQALDTSADEAVARAVLHRARRTA